MSSLDLFRRLFDDAAVFPPGDSPLPHAVSAHLRRRRTNQAVLQGPLVVPAADLPRLAAIMAQPADTLPGHHPAELEDPLSLAMTVPTPLKVGEAVAAARAVPFARLAAVEVAIPNGLHTDHVVPALQAAELPAETAVYAEIPRDHRREPLLAALSGTCYLAKLRTGGVRADLYPGEVELAESLVALVAAGVPFKATAGLHHALRNSDPETGFEQHGFLNLLTAANAAAEGAKVDNLVPLLADRDGARVAAAVGRLSEGVRETFRSLGTCSISEPVDELVALGLLPLDYQTEIAA